MAIELAPQYAYYLASGHAIAIALHDIVLHYRMTLTELFPIHRPEESEQVNAGRTKYDHIDTSGTKNFSVDTNEADESLSQDSGNNTHNTHG